MAKPNRKRVYQFTGNDRNLFAVYDKKNKKLMIEVYPNRIRPIDAKQKEEVLKWLKDNELDLDKLYDELIKGERLVS